VVKPVTVGLDTWEAHELGGDNNTTNRKNVVIKYIALHYIDLSLSIVPYPETDHKLLLEQLKLTLPAQPRLPKW
jgi:hypothetical protein